jgi:hypothetical protein
MPNPLMGVKKASRKDFRSPVFPEIHIVPIPDRMNHLAVLPFFVQSVFDAKQTRWHQVLAPDLVETELASSPNCLGTGSSIDDSLTWSEK